MGRRNCQRKILESGKSWRVLVLQGRTVGAGEEEGWEHRQLARHLAS